MIVHIQLKTLFDNRFSRATIAVMAKQLTDCTSYADAQAYFSPAKLWELFDGTRARLNIAHECIDRHAGRANPAVIVVRADGHDEVLTFADIARDSSRFANYLASARGAGRRSRGGDARAFARVLHGGVRHDEARRHRRAAVHAVRPRRREAARQRLHAASAGDECREGAAADGDRSARRGRGRCLPG